VKREKVSAVCYRRPDPLAGFAYGRVRKSDDGERRGRLDLFRYRLQVHFDIDNDSVDAVHSGGLSEEKHKFRIVFGMNERFLEVYIKTPEE
jgi:hypothetical protein